MKKLIAPVLAFGLGVGATFAVMHQPQPAASVEKAAAPQPPAPQPATAEAAPATPPVAAAAADAPQTDQGQDSAQGQDNARGQDRAAPDQAEAEPETRADAPAEDKAPPLPPLTIPAGQEAVTAAAEAYRDKILATRPNGDRDRLREAAEEAATDAHYRDDWPAAVAAQERAVAADGDKPELWVKIADWSLKLDPAGDKALFAFWQAAKSPDGKLRADALEQIGDILAARQNPKSAAAFYKASLQVRENRNLRQKLADQELGRLRVTEYKVEAEQDQAQICFTLSRPLSKDAQVKFEDYLTVAPAVQTAVTATDDSLCAEGFAHGQNYTVTVRKGLPGRNAALLENAVYKIAVPDRGQRLGFRGNGHILPRSGGQGLPLLSVNVERAVIKLLRVNDRNMVGNLTMGSLYPYSEQRLSEHDGELVWQGTMDIPARKNKEVVTAIPLDEILKNPAPGLYAVTADLPLRNEESYADLATQWLVVTDIGLQTFQGSDGLTLFARSYADGKPLAGVEIKLIARNNDILATAVTDAGGKLRFDPGLLRGNGGRTPRMIAAYGAKNDFTFLDLTQPAFDLTDRGVGGREAPGALDAFLYGDRGIYRPGETANLTLLLRDDKANAVETLPVTLKLARPDGVEARRIVVTPGPGGAVHVPVTFADADRTGGWTVTAHADPKAPPIGSLKLQIEDFMPSRMEVLLKPDQAAVTAGQPLSAAVNARFFYGAPAAGLAADGELVLRRAEQPFPDFAGYRFGLADENFTARRTDIQAADTDDQGRTRLEVPMAAVPETSVPLEAVLRAGVFETGGRVTNRSAVLPVRSRPLYLGLKPQFSGDMAPEGAEARFDVVAVDGEGKATAAGNVAYALYHEDYRYQWYRSGNSWNYRLTNHDRRIASGSLAIAADKPATLAQRLDWGLYRLELRDPATGAATSMRFRAGWATAAVSATDTPDMLKIVAEKQGYRIGETARLHITPPFAGEAVLTVARDGLIDSRQMSIPAEGATVELPVTEGWGAGAYVTASLFRPGKGDAKQGPGRAIGVVWVATDVAPRSLAVTIGTPPEVTPRQTIQVPVSVTGMDGRPAGGPVGVTLAVVDEGILQLTDFASPAPTGYYFGKRRLAVELRDGYGHLIDGRAESRGALRSGGDAAGRHAPGLADKSVKPLSIYSGVVTLDAEGKASIPVTLPDFNGKVRLMAVAFDRNRLGQAETSMLVRAPLVMQASLPRFLAPGDEADLTLGFDNVSAPAGKWTLAFAASGAVTVAQPAAAIDLPAGGKAVHRARIKAEGLGSGRITLTLTGPDGGSRQSDWAVTVRPLQAYQTQQIVRQLQPGETVSLDDRPLQTFLPGSAQTAVTLSTVPDLNAAALLGSLDRYPYGCVEQTTSRALPLLYLSDLGATGQEQATIKPRLDEAITRLVGMQDAEGGFSLWGNDTAGVWLSAYAMDFLLRARDQGHAVPAFAIDRGLNWLKSAAANSEYSADQLAGTAYALHVLARARMVDAGTLRYVHDSHLAKLPTPLAKAQLGSALAMMGDLPRARAAFAAARKPAKTGLIHASFGDYGSHLRDDAAIIALAWESGLADDGLFQLADSLNGQMSDPDRLSTQDKAWAVMAAHALFSRQPELAAEIGGESRTGAKPIVLHPAAAELGQTIALRNLGKTGLYQTMAVSGVPKAEQPPAAHGMTIQRSFYKLDGKPADLAQVHQSDILVAVVSGEATDHNPHHALIVDLLPAGFEIENSRLAHGRSIQGMSWLPDLSEAQHTEFRDDRFVTAIDLTAENGSFAAAYLVRAVTPGSYGLPAAFVEDMYKPQVNARQEVGKVTVLPRR